MLFHEDDTFFNVDNLRHALGAYDYRVPLWLSGHGCTARYLPPTAAGGESGGIHTPSPMNPEGFTHPAL